MPKIYLDPSTNEENIFVDGGSEEYYMNLIVDAMVPYLQLAGIDFDRNNPNETREEIIRTANRENYDLFLSLRATPKIVDEQGIIIYYYIFSGEGMEAAYLFDTNLSVIYPDPALVYATPSGEELLLKSRSVSVIVDLGNSINVEDANWIRDNIYRIARRNVMAVGEYLDLPYPEGL